MRVVVAGCRDYEDYEQARKFLCECLSPYGEESIVILSGGATGADAMGERYAQEMGFSSQNYFSVVFKRETGMTPYAYITKLKLRMAKQLLLESDNSLTQIGLECGFGDYINFYKSFVKAYGEPPLAWKKHKLKEE